MIIPPFTHHLDQRWELIAAIQLIELKVNGRVKRSTMLQRVSPEQLRAGSDQVIAFPTWWAPATDGGIDLWPVYGEQLEIELIGPGGRRLGDQRMVAPIQPVAQYVNSMAAAAEEMRRQIAQPQPIQRYSVPNIHGE